MSKKIKWENCPNQDSAPVPANHHFDCKEQENGYRHGPIARQGYIHHSKFGYYPDMNVFVPDRFRGLKWT